MSALPPTSPPGALLFDLMGTLTDWHSSIVPLLETSPPHPRLPPDSLSQFALDWRAGFFREIQTRFEQSLPSEDIDTTHRRVLDELLESRGVALNAQEGEGAWGENVRARLVGGWHVMRGWPEVRDAMERLKKNFFVVVLANGTTRLQLDIVKSAGLPMHTLFSSQLLGLTKPDPAIYQKAIELIQLRPADCMMVAAHAYDLRAAKKAGMRTAYIQRTTEDPREDMATVRAEVDVFIDGTKEGKDYGLGKLADLLI